MFGFSDGPSYDSGAKFGQTFRSLMQSVKEAFESAHPGTKHLKNIRKFSVPVRGGRGNSAFIVEIFPSGPRYRVHQNGRQLHTNIFDDLLRPILEAIRNAGLSDISEKFPDSILNQATEDEHEFSHMLNAP